MKSDEVVAKVAEGVIAKLAESSADIAARAGVGGCEMAGMVVSVLHTNPDLIPAFLRDPIATVVESERMAWENGCLTWLARNGQVVSPAELRAHLGQLDQ